MEEIEQYLEKSGYYGELSEVLQQKLEKSGWYDNVAAFAGRELGVADNASANSEELAAIRKRALQLVPENVKVELLQHILKILDEYVEKA